jgi:hypothetical protein
MTKLILDIPDQKDLDILLPLLSRLKIHFPVYKALALMIMKSTMRSVLFCKDVR